MAYRESNLDRHLRKWFMNDNSHQLLRAIQIKEGTMRGLTPFSLDFDYPITAIAGKNGSGKSTILALACCAFHNHTKGFKLPHRKQSYYTFADFFIQHTEDIPPEGITIFYKIAHNKWKITSEKPTGEGVGTQKRQKKKGGKWNEYVSRVPRDVVFLGIERIVPHSEKSQSKSYSKSFANTGIKGWENDVRLAVGKILNKKYDSFTYVSHSKYRLPLVTCNGKKYSGFHMGAGENALFETLSVIHSCSEGALIVIDEIELGLHSEAQKKFISHLKDLCKERKIQILCTTHSKDIFCQLPDDARIFIETVNGKSVISKSISPEFAFSKLSAENSGELCILVEDNVAKSLLQAVLPNTVRARITIEVIGSASALTRQLSSNYIRSKKENLLVIFDGDQKSKEKGNLSHGYKMTESTKPETEIKNWMKENIQYLPGDTWPESWIIQKCMEIPEIIAPLLGLQIDEINYTLEQGLEAGKHNEFNTIGSIIGLEEQDVLTRFCVAININFKSEFERIKESISNRLIN